MCVKQIDHQVVGSGAAGNWYLDHRGATMTRGEFAPGFKLGLHHKDLKICQQMATDKGAALSCVEVSLADYAELMQRGQGEDDTSAMYQLKLELFTKG